MSYSVRVQVPRPREPLNASALAKAQATAARDWQREALIGGWSPVDGSDRPRKGNQKPLGYDTGTLARGLRVVAVESSRERAAFAIEPPSSRRDLAKPKLELGGLSFLERYQILSLEGRTADVIDEATDAYFADLRRSP